MTTDEFAKSVPQSYRLTMVVTLAVLATTSASSAQPHSGALKPDGDGERLQVQRTVTFSRDALVFGELKGFDTVRLTNGGCLHEPGKPKLPAMTMRIALPADMTVTGVRVVAVEREPLAGVYSLYPAQPPKPISDQVPKQDFVPPDPDIYTSSEVYPGTPVEFCMQTDLAGQGIAVVRLHPLQYVPDKRELTLLSSITFALEGIDGYECGDYLPTAISTRGRRAYEQMVRSMVVNPEDVALTMSHKPASVSRGVGPGEYEYVIITQSGWVDDFQTLADWRTKKGKPSTIVTTDWIYNNGGYVGSDIEKIRAFVEDAHDNWGATYFLLGGDANIIPYHTRTITIPVFGLDDVPNDTYYADYDEDWTCEVHVGRAPVHVADHVSTFINKVFTYEKNPPLSNYVTTAAVFGFDITDPGDAHGQITKENIRSLHLPLSWTISTEYDSEPGTHMGDVLAYLNQGHHLVNHHDHCDWNCMGTGWISHGDLIYNADVNGLTNGDRLSILFAVGCLPANFPLHTSIGEDFVRNPNGGGVAFIGNTRYGWGGSLEDPDWYTSQQDRFFYRNLFDDGFVELGANFTDLKNDEFDPYDPNNLHQYCFTQLHLLGDPEVPVWTEDPESLAVTHDDVLTVGEPTTFLVEVYSGGNPMDGATVCLWKDGDIYEVENTVAGVATFEITPATTGTMYVTATEHNYLPYEGQAVVGDTSDGDCDGDGDVDLSDFLAFQTCFTGPGGTLTPGCVCADFDGDDDVDLQDFLAFQTAFTGPGG